MNEAKIIFLDIDGVVCLYPEWQCEWSGNQNTSFNNACCKNLKDILDATGAKIVIISSWRLNTEHFEDMCVKFERSGLPGIREQIIGQTESFRNRDDITGHVQMRWLEIQDYLAKNKIDKYIVIDDFALNKYDKEHTIRTKMHIGLTAHLADVCIRKLGVSRGQIQ